MTIKYLNTIIFIILCTISLFGQNSVLLNNNEFGQGLLRSRNGKCYVITAKHIIEGYEGIINVIGPYNSKARATKEKVYTYDLAILEVQGKNFECDTWNDLENFDLALESSNKGFLNIRNESGGMQPIPVIFLAKGDERLLIKNSDSTQPILPGMSGGALVVNGINVGILLNVDTDTNTGTILRKDFIARLTEQFFEGRRLSISKDKLNRITDNILNFQIRSNHITLSGKKLREASEYIDEIWLGNQRNLLNLKINLKAYRTINRDAYIKLPIIFDKDLLYGKVKYTNGSFSSIKTIKNYNANNIYMGKALELLQPKNNSHIDPVFFYSNANQKDNPFIMPVVPMKTKIVRYKFDDGGFFEKGKEYGLFRIELPFNAEHITLEYVLEDDSIKGPYRYKKLDLTEELLFAYKTSFNDQLESNFSCFRIPAKRYYKNPKDLPKTPKELLELSKRSNWLNVINTQIIVYIGIKPDLVFTDEDNLVCSINYAKRVITSPVYFSAIKTVMFGTNPEHLNTILNVDVELEECFNNQNECRKKLTSALFGKIPLKDFNTDVYLQYRYYDDTFSRVYRIKVDNMFDKYFED